MAGGTPMSGGSPRAGDAPCATGRRDAARDPAEIRFRVRLTPRAGLDHVDGVDGGELRCRVAASPVDGAANEALVRLLARELGVARSSVRIVGGVASRHKTVAIDAAARATLDARWPGLAG